MEERVTLAPALGARSPWGSEFLKPTRPVPESV
jgi:hypothetical protein